MDHDRHGIKQLRSGWSDGPAYVTQCPIQPGQSFVYNFTTTGQRGTLLWHAHITWLRATVYGAIVILPKRGISYPFPTPDKEKTIILGKFYHRIKCILSLSGKIGFNLCLKMMKLDRFCLYSFHFDMTRDGIHPIF